MCLSPFLIDSTPLDDALLLRILAMVMPQMSNINDTQITTMSIVGWADDCTENEIEFFIVEFN